MKKTTLLKSMLLLCALVVGSTSAWAEDVTVTWNISGVVTSANYQKVNTALTTSSITPSGASGTWTAVSDGSSSYAASSSGAQLGASSSREFNGTVSLSSTSIPSSATITSVAVTITANGASTLSTKVGGNSLGSSKSVTGTTATYTMEGSQTGNEIVLTFSSTQSGKYIKITKIVVNYSATTVAVTGVSLPSTANAYIGKKITLTPTFTPADATNKNVTWESKNTSIATVSDAGEVTGVAEGTVDIEVTTEDGGYQATCKVTVGPYYVNLTSPVSITDWPSLSYGSAADYEADGIIFTATQCMKNSGFQFKASAGILASPLIKSTNGYTVIVTTNGTGTGTLTLQIGSETPVSVASGTSSSYSATTSSTSTSFTLTNSSGKACNIATLSIIPNTMIVSLNAKGYATYSSASDFTFSGEGIKAYKMALDEGEKTITGTEVTGKIKAGEGILFKGAASANVTITLTTGASALDGNSLKGSTKADGTTAAKPTYCYVLSGDTFVSYSGATLAANKAYFEASSDLADARPFTITFEDGGATGIAGVEAKKFVEDNKFYNLNGQQVAQPTKGLYIVNGKKVVIK